MNTLLIFLTSVISFWAENPSKAKDVMTYYDNNPCIKQTLSSRLTNEHSFMGMSIVAPEIATHSEFIDYLETEVMEMMYVEFNRSDFSIGPFQMKPSFAVFIENYISKNKIKKFKDLIITASSERETRKVRIRRLLSVKWQAIYLSAFLYYAESYTRAISFDSTESKLKYWATLYNSRIDSSPSEVKKIMQSKLFPHFAPRYNYSDVVYEFFEIMND